MTIMILIHPVSHIRLLFNNEDNNSHDSSLFSTTFYIYLSTCLSVYLHDNLGVQICELYVILNRCNCLFFLSLTSFHDETLADEGLRAADT